MKDSVIARIRRRTAAIAHAQPLPDLFATSCRSPCGPASPFAFATCKRSRRCAPASGLLALRSQQLAQERNRDAALRRQRRAIHTLQQRDQRSGIARLAREPPVQYFIV